MAVDCLKCHRIHKCGDGVYYCPFFDINPCVCGEHYVFLTQSQLLPPPADEPVIPEFKPPQGQGKHIIDWAKYHEKVFELYYAGQSFIFIGRRLGVSAAAVENYISRYN